jgi:hypothetical protein
MFAVMEQKNHGGKRRGAGRKSVIDKKQQVVLYVPGKDVLKFGSPDKLKDNLKKFIDEFGGDSKINYQPTTEASYDGKKFTPVDDEPLKFEKPKIALKRTPAHWVELRRECSDADEYAQWLQNLENDPHLTAREKKEIKATV